MSVVDRARVIASIAHKDQKDKAGKPYLLHLLAVAEKVETEQFDQPFEDVIIETIEILNKDYQIKEVEYL